MQKDALLALHAKIGTIRRIADAYLNLLGAGAPDEVKQISTLASTAHDDVWTLIDIEDGIPLDHPG